MKNVLVIGAGNGNIGQAIADKFREAEDYLVFTADKESETADYFIDVTDPVSVKTVLMDIKIHHKHLDVVVNAAGVNWMGSVRNYTKELFNQVLDINLTSNFTILQAYDDLFGQKEYRKCFLSITSDSGIIPKSNSTAYCASKAGANHLMITAAREFAKFNKNWVIIPLALGRVAGTPMDCRTKFDMSQQMGITTDEAEDMLNRNIPLGRGMTLKEVGEWAYFLAEKGDYAHGCVLRIDGGQLQG